MRPLLISLLTLLPLPAQTLVELEATAWGTRLNEVRKPSQGGTTFSFPDLLGSGPIWAPRLNVSWPLNERHGLRVLLAPFEASGTGVFREPVVYQGHTFQAGVPVEGLYRFNSWRVTWRYTLRNDATWRVLAGATAKIRDAKVQLRQNGHTESNSNVGFVPLAHLYVERRFPKNVSVVFETDALAASQGRAVDAALMLRWQATHRLHADVGYRLLEGGADNKELYTWARLDGWRGGMGIRF
jgi:hypothetical protein